MSAAKLTGDERATAKERLHEIADQIAKIHVQEDLLRAKLNALRLEQASLRSPPFTSCGRKG